MCHGRKLGLTVATNCSMTAAQNIADIAVGASHTLLTSDVVLYCESLVSIQQEALIGYLKQQCSSAFDATSGSTESSSHSAGGTMTYNSSSNEALCASACSSLYGTALQKNAPLLWSLHLRAIQLLHTLSDSSSTAQGMRHI